MTGWVSHTVRDPIIPRITWGIKSIEKTYATFTSNLFLFFSNRILFLVIDIVKKEATSIVIEENTDSKTMVNCSFTQQ